MRIYFVNDNGKEKNFYWALILWNVKNTSTQENCEEFS